jgi:hypothetical protein
MNDEKVGLVDGQWQLTDLLCWLLMLSLLLLLLLLLLSAHSCIVVRCQAVRL